MNRRHFIQLTTTALAATLYNRLVFTLPDGSCLLHLPDEVWVQLNGQWTKMNASNGTVFTYQDVRAELKNNGQSVFVQSPSSELEGIKLKWRYKVPTNAKVLGDHWERAYGDLAWKTPNAAQKSPWYVLINDGMQTACFGVKTGAKTICWWNLEDQHIELNLDTHSGAAGVKLGQRKLHAADLVTLLGENGETAYVTTTRFCKMMCDKPLLPKQPVYGINDWYVVYGNNSAKTIIEQTSTMAQFISSTNNKPFSVIDDGWQVADDFSKVNDKFKDMHEVALKIKQQGMRPGLWTRPLIAKKTDPASFLAPKINGRNDPNELILDPTIPETLERVKQNISLYKDWGYELVKHDYSTYDIFGKWGFRMTDSFTQPGWKFYDQSKTNAEIILDLYQVIRQNAGSMYIIGCNTMSHLSAGLFELNRTGDDTSGREWARTKKMGVNTLGFRLPQHRAFYAADGDCVGLTKEVPWDKNKQWMQLLAESGSPLFISAQLDFLGAEQKAAIRQAFAQAATVQPTGEPLDWMTNPWPSKWKLNNREVSFDWG